MLSVATVQYEDKIKILGVGALFTMIRVKFYLTVKDFAFVDELL